MGLLAPSFHVDVEKALMMCLVHDLGELYIGDISAATRPDEVQKHMDEERDVRRVLSLLPDGQRDCIFWRSGRNTTATPQRRRGWSRRWTKRRPFCSTIRGRIRRISITPSIWNMESPTFPSTRC